MEKRTKYLLFQINSLRCVYLFEQKMQSVAMFRATVGLDCRCVTINKGVEQL